MSCNFSLDYAGCMCLLEGVQELPEIHSLHTHTHTHRGEIGDTDLKGHFSGYQDWWLFLWYPLRLLWSVQPWNLQIENIIGFKQSIRVNHL
ncbi:hypothetical protein GDO86_005325 [Hymenochirus boettgeri]|uniref:Uncharacterized protein n=1 Tax=Hymenochirus boettgeri TaxID=247094 RepID=A0A8T2J5M0_9PIPI|nr:hypothetical protein GDO86_005325 [Hymenochirus boettgeri]